MNLATVEIRAFVPGVDFERSKAFYTALGFGIPWSSWPGPGVSRPTSRRSAGTA